MPIQIVRQLGSFLFGTGRVGGREGGGAEIAEFEGKFGGLGGRWSGEGEWEGWVGFRMREDVLDL